MERHDSGTNVQLDVSVIQQKNLYEVKLQEKELLEAQALPLRNYLMKYVMPSLTEALLHCSKIKPEDPVDFLVRTHKTFCVHREWLLSLTELTHICLFLCRLNICFGTATENNCQSVEEICC